MSVLVDMPVRTQEERPAEMRQPEQRFAERRPVEQPLALVADGVAGSVELTRSALAACGAVTVMATNTVAGGMLPETLGRQPDLLIADQDFGSRGQGIRLVEAALAQTQASVILIGADMETLPIATFAGRCHLLHRPVHGGQLRTTIKLALAERQKRAQDGTAEARPRMHLVERPRTFRSIDDLRPRERDIARLLLQHCRVPAVARALGISPHTVRNHLKNIYRRLDVHSQQELLDVLTQG